MVREYTGISSLLRQIADTIDRVGEDRFRELLRQARQGDAKPEKTGAKRRTSEKGRSVPTPIRHSLVESVAERLRHLSSTEQGRLYLENSELSRRELEAVARLIEVPVRKDIRVSELEELIVNVTIGGRLNSLAIRGDR